MWRGWSSAAVLHGARNWGLSPLQLHLKNGDAGNMLLYSGLIPEHLVHSFLNPEETMVSQETSQSLPPPVSQQHQKTEGLQHIYLLLAPVFLGVIKEKVSSLPIIKAFFFSFWQSICPAETSCCFCSVWHAQFCWPFNNFIDTYYG